MVVSAVTVEVALAVVDVAVVDVVVKGAKCLCQYISGVGSLVNSHTLLYQIYRLYTNRYVNNRVYSASDKTKSTRSCQLADAAGE